MSEKPTRILRLGTRGSLLAKTQSQLIADEIEKRHPGYRVDLVVIKTTGDEITQDSLAEHGGKGLFTKEIELALLNHDVDFAVHSYKDVPVTMPLVDQQNLRIVATTLRENPADVLVLDMDVRDGLDALEHLSRGAIIGTGSLRRQSQLLALRPDLVIKPIRGNIDTRLRKLADGEFRAIVLAYAGLHRAGLFNAQRMILFSEEQMLPSAGQGALALECRADDEETATILLSMDDPETHLCVSCERAVVEQLGGDCHSPIGVLARVDRDKLTLKVAVGARDGGGTVLCAQASSWVTQTPDVLTEVVQLLEKQGVRSHLHGKNI